MQNVVNNAVQEVVPRKTEEEILTGKLDHVDDTIIN